MVTARVVVLALAAAALLPLAGCRSVEVPTFAATTAAVPAPPVAVEGWKEPGMVHATDPEGER